MYSSFPTSWYILDETLTLYYVIMLNLLLETKFHQIFSVKAATKRKIKNSKKKFKKLVTLK